MESRNDGNSLDVALHSNVLLYDTLLTLVRFGVCVCVGGGGRSEHWGGGGGQGRSEHWRAGRIRTDWIWPHTAVFCSVTLLTLVRFGVCVGGGGGGGRLMMICNNDL